jgi:hypothetical protein
VDNRNESIERFVAGQLTDWEVPGCAIAAVFVLDESGTVVQHVAQPLGIFRPKT